MTDTTVTHEPTEAEARAFANAYGYSIETSRDYLRRNGPDARYTAKALEPTLVPGPGKVQVVLRVTWRSGFGGEDIWVRYADTTTIDPEHWLASNLAAVALTEDDGLRRFLVSMRDDEVHPDAAQVRVLLTGPCDGGVCCLYDEALCDIWDTLCSGVDAPPAWDWTVTP